MPALIDQLRALVPARVTVGISGDASGASGLRTGCDTWYSALAGTFSQAPLIITRAVQTGHAQEAPRLSDRLAPLWAVFKQ